MNLNEIADDHESSAVGFRRISGSSLIPLRTHARTAL